MQNAMLIFITFDDAYAFFSTLPVSLRAAEATTRAYKFYFLPRAMLDFVNYCQ